MSFFDGFTPAYTFRLQIERNDRGILDTSITARGEADEIAKAKQNIQRMLDEYTPDIKAAEPAQPLAADIDTTSEPEAKDTDDQHHTEDPRPVSEQETESSAPADKQEGAKGLLRLRCPECGSTFGTFLKEYQRDIACKCGHHIDLTAPPARYRFTCPYCEKDTWGQTNLEDPEITIRCRCGGNVDLWWVPKAKEYQN